LTVDAEGHLFVSDFFANTVLRFEVGTDAQSTTRTLISSAIASPNGLIVQRDDLLVLSYADGTLTAIANGRLGPGTGSEELVTGLGNPDGVVMASDATLFVTDNGSGRVLSVDADNVVSVVAQNVSAAANLEFGTAPLRCDRLLVTSSGALRVLDVGVGGAPVPWR
jgi:sugar lactone lactonase YvrE